VGELKHTLTPSTYFQGVKTPQPQDLRPWLSDGGEKNKHVDPVSRISPYRRSRRWSG